MPPTLWMRRSFVFFLAPRASLTMLSLSESPSMAKEHLPPDTKQQTDDSGQTSPCAEHPFKRLPSYWPTPNGR